MSKKTFLIGGCLSIIIPLYAQTKEASDPDVLKEMVGIVVSVPESDKEIQDLVSIFMENEKYDEKEIGTDSPWQVLDYLTTVYSEHGYHESGNWSPETKIRRNTYTYVTVKEELPEYEFEDFRLPVKGNLTSSYGYRPRFRRFHHGIDVALHPGDTVASSLPGIVTLTGYQKGGYGIYVIVSHAGGVETLYGHLQVCLVKPGQHLKSGEPLGLGGSSGNATGPHLHFESRYRGVPIDPISWFNLSDKFR